MWALLLVAACVVVAAILGLAAFEVAADRWAEYVDGARAELDDDTAETLAFLDEVRSAEVAPLHLPGSRHLAVVPPQRTPDEVWWDRYMSDPERPGHFGGAS